MRDAIIVPGKISEIYSIKHKKLSYTNMKQMIKPRNPPEENVTSKS